MADLDRHRAPAARKLDGMHGLRDSPWEATGRPILSRNRLALRISRAADSASIDVEPAFSAPPQRVPSCRYCKQRCCVGKLFNRSRKDVCRHNHALKDQMTNPAYAL